MRPRPEHLRAPSFETRKHDPEAITDSKFHKSLKAEAGYREISEPAAEPGFAWSAYFNGNEHMAALCQATILPRQLRVRFSAHSLVSYSFMHILVD